MNNKTPERSIEEIVEEFREQFSAYQTTSNQPYPMLTEWLTQTLQTDRQKREEAVEAERKSFRKTLDNLYQESLENWAIDSDDYRKAINKMTIALTQPNNPK